MTGSVWIDARRTAAAPLAGEVRTGVVVVGAGITGAATAWRLAGAGHEVVLLESRHAGEGNTGRSTGNLYATLSSGLTSLRDKWSDREAADAVAARAGAVEWRGARGRSAAAGVLAPVPVVDGARRPRAVRVPRDLLADGGQVLVRPVR